MIDLDAKSKQLKQIVGKYDTKYFLGEISSMMNFIRSDKPNRMLSGLSSPQRQLYYLAALNITSEVESEEKIKYQFSNEEFNYIKKLLIEIESGYAQYFYPKPEDKVDEDWNFRRKIAMPAFLNYFNQGHLNYEEQEAERIERYFAPFNTEILNHFGIGVADFIEIYDFIDAKPNEVLNAKVNPKKGQQTWHEFLDEMKQKEVMPDQYATHLPQHFKDLFGVMQDKGQLTRFTKSELSAQFGRKKASAFLDALTCHREQSGFLYYTELNPLLLKPIVQLGEDECHSIEMKQILHAIYRLLMEFCVSQERLNEKFYKRRGLCLEEKIEEVFQSYFDGKAQVFKGFYTQEKHEQDLLIIIDGLALIIEAKASNRDEPRRDPDKAYQVILRNFDKTIQKGYDQAYRVKEKFLYDEKLRLYEDQRLSKHIIDLNTSKYYHAFSIVVTQERFGQIQTDMSELLEIWDDDGYPWSICIDDLEVFLLYLKKKNKKKSFLTLFLNVRQKLHGKLITADELEVCGGFLNGKINLKLANSDTVLPLTPDLAGVFDDVYQKSTLDFTKEKNVELKTSGKVIPLGGF